MTLFAAWVLVINPLISSWILAITVQWVFYTAQPWKQLPRPDVKGGADIVDRSAEKVPWTDTHQLAHVECSCVCYRRQLIFVNRRTSILYLKLEATGKFSINVTPRPARTSECHWPRSLFCVSLIRVRQATPLFRSMSFGAWRNVVLVPAFWSRTAASLFIAPWDPKTSFLCYTLLAWFGEKQFIKRQLIEEYHLLWYNAL
jgi:hypothetical protein